MKWMKTKMIKVQVLLSLLGIVYCSTAFAQQPSSKSLLWEISGNGLQEPSYLFGTIHMICKEDFLLSETAKQKFNSSKQVYLELDMDDPQLQMMMMQQLQLPSNESLKNMKGNLSSTQIQQPRAVLAGTRPFRYMIEATIEVQHGLIPPRK